MAGQETRAVAVFAPPRLPYAPVIEERFGIDKGGWKTLVEAIWPSAKTVDGVALALNYCKRRNLDPFKKPVHIVPVWSSAKNCEVEGVWPGISELRTTAMRTREYAGCDETEFGPDITRVFNWTDRRNNSHTAEVTFPEWARMTVYRMVGNVRCAFVGPKVLWLETYATVSRFSDAPNDMWRKRPHGQLDKCAEAAALRKAFPEELGNEYAAEEMAGRVIGADNAPVPTTFQAKPTQKLHADFDEDTGEVIDADFDPNACDAEADQRYAEEDNDPTFIKNTDEALEEHHHDFPGDRKRDQLLEWASEVRLLLPDFKTLADLNAYTDQPEMIAKFEALSAAHPKDAKSLSAAITGRRKALAGKEQPDS